VNQPTYVELFAGAGGLSLGLDRAGWRCAGHAEIEPHARAVLRRHWPDTPLYGDVSTLDGTQWRGITLLSGGSPCQDLSIAGKREGLTGRRSGLFHHQVRLWVESQAPLFLWENVVGALSSHAGKDFARIISSILGEPVAVPRDGRRQRVKWATAGYVEGTRGVALAWRVLDLRRFGIPQRRRRVFIVAARGGLVCPRELLSLDDGLQGHPQAVSQTGQADPGAAERESGVGGERALTFQLRGRDGGVTVEARSDGVINAIRVPNGGRMGLAGADGVLDTRALAVNISDSRVSLDSEMGTLGARSGGQEVGAQTRGVVFDARGNGDGQTCNTLAGDHQNRVTDYTAIVVRASAQANAETLADASPTLNCGHDGPPILGLPRPRRLMPVECEKLMSWPPSWTEYGIDEQGREYRLKDTPRYKCCGNGVGSVVAEWIGRRMLQQIHTSRR